MATTHQPLVPLTRDVSLPIQKEELDMVRARVISRQEAIEIAGGTLERAEQARRLVDHPPIEATHRVGERDPFTAHTPKPFAPVKFIAVVDVSYSEMQSDSFETEEMVRKYGPELLQQLFTQIENWRFSNKLDPVTPEEATSQTEASTP